MILTTCGVAHAEVWQSERWALLASTEASAGYDSNLTLSEDGPGSSFLSAQPGLTLRRHGSATKLDLGLQAQLTEYFGESDFQTDGAAWVDYAYPHVEDALPRFLANARVARTTAGHASLGRRVTSLRTQGSATGQLYSSGKLGLESQLSYLREDFSEDDLNTNDRAELNLGASYEPDPKKEYSLNALFAFGNSRPGNVDRPRVRSREYGLVAQARGQLLPKVSGTVRAGLASVRYRGDFHRSDVLPIASGALTWQANERAQLTAGLEVGADFSPEGESLAVRRLILTYRHTVYGPWRLQARLVPSSISYYQDVHTRDDQSLGAGLALVYEPSERFAVSLGHDFTTQDSDVPYLAYERHVTTANLSYRF